MQSIHTHLNEHLDNIQIIITCQPQSFTLIPQINLQAQAPYFCYFGYLHISYLHSKNICKYAQNISTFLIFILLKYYLLLIQTHIFCFLLSTEKNMQKQQPNNTKSSAKYDVAEVDYYHLGQPCMIMVISNSFRELQHSTYT